MKVPAGMKLHRAKWPSRCRVCSGAVAAGDLIAIPVDEAIAVPASGSRAVWIHATCLRDLLVDGERVRKSEAREGYRRRRSRRRRHRSTPHGAGVLAGAGQVVS